MIATQERGGHTNREVNSTASIWNEDLFESHARDLSLPVVRKLLIYLDQLLRELLSVSTDPARHALASALLCQLAPLAAFLGYSALAELTRPITAAPVAARPSEHQDIAIVMLTSEYVQNMLASIPTKLAENE